MGYMALWNIENKLIKLMTQMNFRHLAGHLRPPLILFKGVHQL
jgi:hypothetical protein